MICRTSAAGRRKILVANSGDLPCLHSLLVNVSICNFHPRHRSIAAPPWRWVVFTWCWPPLFLAQCLP